METDPNSNPTQESTPSQGSSSISTPSNGTQDNQIVMLTLPISTKLDRDNYLSWQSQIVPLLHAYDMYQFLESKSPPSTMTTAAGELQINPNYLSWYKQDQMLLGWLQSSLTREVLAQVVFAKTSVELWTSLQQSFYATSRDRLSELHRNLQNTTKGGSSCLEYIHKLQSVADELSFIGEPVSDTNLQMYLLQGLGSEFDSLVVAVQTAPPRSIADLTALIYSHE